MNELHKILNCFDVLGVPYFSDYTVVKTSFRKKIKELHPDVSRTKDDEEVKKLISAYKYLQSLYKNKELVEYYRNEFFKTQNKKFVNLPFKNIIHFVGKHHKLIIKAITLIAVIAISTLIFDNLINIALFILVVIGGYFAFNRL